MFKIIKYSGKSITKLYYTILEFVIPDNREEEGEVESWVQEWLIVKRKEKQKANCEDDWSKDEETIVF